MKFIEKILSGATGRLIRSVVSLAVGLLAAKYKDNVWYVSATPLLQTASKALRDKYPDKFDWLPF